MGIVEGALLAISAVGTALSVNAQRKQAKREDAIADQQEQITRDDAAYAASEAQVQARMIRKAAEKQRAEARAALASSGVVVGEGTAEQIDTEIAADAEQDALLTIYDGTNRARGITVAGEQAAQRTRNAAAASRTGALTSALQGGATIASGWNTTSRRKPAGGG